MISSDQTTRTIELPAADLRELFATPVLQYLWPDSATLNRSLRDLVLRKRDESPGVVKTNRGGWQSEADLQNWPEDCVQILLARVRSMIREMVRRTVPDLDERHLENWSIRAWANANTTGGFNTPHHHYGPNSLWSGFYYVDLGQLSPDTSVSGRTLFQDRSGVAKEIMRNPNVFEREVAVSPQPGMMVLFPARLWHYVEPYSGNGLRITIAFNLWHPGFRVPYYPGMRQPSWWWANFRGLMILPSKVLEKLHGLVLLPKHLFERQLPSSLKWRDWWNHLRVAKDHALAEASAVSIQKHNSSDTKTRY